MRIGLQIMYSDLNYIKESFKKKVKYELYGILCRANSCIKKDLPFNKTELLKTLFNKSIHNFYSVILFTSTCDVTPTFPKKML